MGVISAMFLVPLYVVRVHGVSIIICGGQRQATQEWEGRREDKKGRETRASRCWSACRVGTARRSYEYDVKGCSDLYPDMLAEARVSLKVTSGSPMFVARCSFPGGGECR